MHRRDLCDRIPHNLYIDVYHDVPQRKLRHLYNGARYLVFQSRGDGFGLVGPVTPNTMQPHKGQDRWPEGAGIRHILRISLLRRWADKCAHTCDNQYAEPNLNRSFSHSRHFARLLDLDCSRSPRLSLPSKTTSHLGDFAILRV